MRGMRIYKNALLIDRCINRFAKIVAQVRNRNYFVCDWMMVHRLDAESEHLIHIYDLARLLCDEVHVKTAKYRVFNRSVTRSKTIGGITRSLVVSMLLRIIHSSAALLDYPVQQQ